MDDLSGLDWSKPDRTQPKPPPTAYAPSFASLRPTPSPVSSGRSTPASQLQPTISQTKSASANSADDSFSNLVSFGSAKPSQNLTLAERQAQLEAEKKKQADEQRKTSEAHFRSGEHWNALGSRSFTPSPSLQPPFRPAPAAIADDDDLFAAFNKDTSVDKSSHFPPPVSDRSSPANGNRTDTAQQSGPSSGTFPNHGWVAEDDPFGLNGLKPPQGPMGAASVSNPGEDDTDFMGDLAKPVEEIRRKHQQSRPDPQPRPAVHGQTLPFQQRPSSPTSARLERSEASGKAFDEAMAQLVDYGFTPQEAVRGLTESGAGLDVQAAANWLLDDAHRKAKQAARGKGTMSKSNYALERTRSGFDDNAGTPDLAKSAATMSSTFIKTASSIWKSGQKKMQQAVADFQQDGDPGQPRWMRDAQHQHGQRSRVAVKSVTEKALALDAGRNSKSSRSTSKSVRDQEGQHDRRQQATTTSFPPRGEQLSPAPRWRQQQHEHGKPPAVSDARSRLNRLAAGDNFLSHVNPNSRRKVQPSTKPSTAEIKIDLSNTSASKPAQSVPSNAAQRRAAPVSQQPQRMAKPAGPAPIQTRLNPPVDAGTLHKSTKHRLEGDAHCKRGDYVLANASYSSSMVGLPKRHPALIVLFTSRALTALKTGEPRQAVTDADEALQLIGPERGHGESISLPADTGDDVPRHMTDLYGTALSRKAEALEQLEKWSEAGTVWQQCVEAGVDGAISVRGRQRCQMMLAPKPKSSTRPAARPRPKQSAAASLAPPRSSEAVNRLRAAHESAAREDDEKFAFSDKVDAKVSAWREGKRDNLRALLGSLDKVLWSDSGWKPVGLHELVMVNKVKVVYMKAIAKTHPDKLPQDAGTEVRLIAGLVFSTLNESWDKFKIDNGL